MDANSADTNTGALVGLRVAVGVLFLIFAQYKVFGGASLEHLVPAMCFATFALADSEAILSLRPWLRRRSRS